MTSGLADRLTTSAGVAETMPELLKRKTPAAEATRA